MGAGAGAVVGGRKGGVGTASAVLDSGATVAALVVLNAVGSAIDPASGLPHGLRAEVDGEFGPVAPVAPVAPSPPTPGTATTLAVVATDLTLDKAGAARLATMGHDGLARAINPVHTVMDGDTIFGLSTCARPAPSAGGTLRAARRRGRSRHPRGRARFAESRDRRDVAGRTLSQPPANGGRTSRLVASATGALWSRTATSSRR